MLKGKMVLLASRLITLVLLGLVLWWVRVTWPQIELGGALITSQFLISGYLLASLRYQKLASINSYLVYLTASVLILMEFSFHAFPSLTPTELLTYLEPDERRDVARKRGLFTDMRGEDMLYFYRPNDRLPAFPHVKLDADGYRNMQEWPRNPDVVLLGDSITMAVGAKKDLGDLFREDGLSVINLGMGGYGPQQYRDSFTHFIKGRDIKPKIVVMVFFVGNDFRDADKYEEIVANGGDYREYLREALPPIKFAWYIPRIVRLYLGWRHYDSWRLRNKQSDIIVKLPYKEITVNHLWFPPEIKPTDKVWRNVAGSLRSTKEAVNSTGAKLVICIMPSPATLYSQFDSRFKQHDRTYETTLKTMEIFAKNEGIKIHDLNPGLRGAIKEKFLFLSDSDTHFNTQGIEVLYSLVKEKIQVLLDGNPP